MFFDAAATQAEVDAACRALLGVKAKLRDFRYVEGGSIRSLEMTADSLYVVADYRWAGFGMAFERFIVKGTDEETAIKYFRE